MTTDTLLETDLSWVVFADEDTSEPCAFDECSRESAYKILIDRSCECCPNMHFVCMVHAENCRLFMKECPDSTCANCGKPARVVKIVPIHGA